MIRRPGIFRYARLAACGALVAGLGVAAGGCSLLSEYRTVDREALRNPQGHVVGQKEFVRHRDTGERVTRISLYTPRRNDAGAIVAYEERTRGGSLIRDLDGQVIGGRYKDLRSRGTNAYSQGVTLIFAQPATRKAADIPSDSEPFATVQASLPARQIRPN